MTWELKVYDPDNDTEQGALSEAYGVSWADRLGTVGVLSFGIDRESTADEALLDHRRVVRVYEDSEALAPFAAGFVDDDPAELAVADELPKVSYRCPSLDAWLGTSDLGGAVVYPFGGLSGRQQDPRRFGPEALEFDDSGWSSPTTDGNTPDSFAGGEPSWFVSTNRSLFRLVIPSGSGSFPGRMLLRASRRLNVEVYLDADRVLSKSDGQTGVTQFDVDYDDSEDRVVLIDVAGSGKVGWAWGEVVEDEDDTAGALGDVFFKSDDTWKQLDDYTTYPGMTPGYIAKTLVEEAQARGALSGLSIDFDEDEDSDGVPWSGTVAHAFSVGSKLGWVLEQITQFGYDWRVNPDGILQIFELLGEDRSASVDLDVLEEHKAAGEGIKATALLWLSAGSMDDMQVASAVGRIEEAATFGTSASAVKLEAVAANLLDDLAIPRDTSTLALSQDSPQPYEDFWLGDVVAYTDRDGPSTGRVTEIVGTQDDADGTVSWSVTVDFETGQFSRERERRIRDQLREAFAQTVGGRALLAAPRPDRGDGGGGVTVADGGGGLPSTITLHAVDVEVPTGLPAPVEFTAAIEDVSRRSLFPVELPQSAVPLPYAGTWEVTVRLDWELTESFRGGGTVGVRLDGNPVWPLTPEATVGEPDDAYDLPSFARSVTVVADKDGELSVTVGQDSGDTQTGTLVVEVALREPQGVGQVRPAQSNWPDLVVGGWIAIGRREFASSFYIVANGVVQELSFPAQVSTGHSVAWSPNRRELAIGYQSDESPSLVVVSTETGEIADGWETFDDGGTTCLEVTYSPDGSLLAMARHGSASEPSLRIVDTANKTLLAGVPSINGYSSGAGWCRGVAFSPDGTRLAVAFSGSPYYAVIDLATLTIESGWPSVLSAEGAGVTWSPDGSILVVSGASAQVKLLDVATKTDVTGEWTFPSGSYGGRSYWAFSPDGARLAGIYGTGSSGLRVLDVATKSGESGWPTIDGGGYSIAWFGDTGERLAIGTGSTALAYDGLLVLNTATKGQEEGWPALGTGNSERARSVAFAWDPGSVSKAN